MAGPDPEVLDRLDAQDWDELYEDLVAYAIRRMEQLSWVRGADALPKGKEPEDFVEEAIECLYTGRRSWDYETYPDIVGVLKGIISSLVSNLVQSAEHRRAVDVEKPGEGDDFYEAIVPADADANLIGQKLRETMRAAVADNDELALVLDAMLSGTPNAEIAEMLDVDRNRVYQLRRNVRRRVRKALNEQE